MPRLIALWIALIAGALIAAGQARPPRPAPLDAPPAAFSAARAFAELRQIAAQPHPIGSQANRRVRDLLLARMAALGLSPRARVDDVIALQAAGPAALVGGSPETLVGVLPGRNRAAPALAIMAHYDSVPGAPGAGDDGAGVAAALEAVRALKARGAPARDVVLVLTDGEEPGLLGARGFFAHDPEARRIGFVINLEARGAGGRVQMFQTGRQNGAVIDAFRANAVRPQAGSLFGFVYALLPNDTDFSIARAAGVQGLNFAFTGSAFDYHQPSDAPANLDPGSLQDMGDQLLAAASAFAHASRLPPRAPDVVYSQIFGDMTLAYAPPWGWVLLAVAAGLIALALRRARRREAISSWEVARGAAAGAYAVIGSASLLAAAQAAATRTGADFGGPILAQAHRWEAALILLATGFLLFSASEAARGRRLPAVLVPVIAAASACALAGRLEPVAVGCGLAAAVLSLAFTRAPLSRPAAWSGVLLLGLAAGAALQAAAPLAAYPIQWPLLAGAVAAAASDLATLRGRGRLVALTLIGALALGWIGVHAHLIVVVVQRAELLVLPVFMAALVLWPLAQPSSGAPPARLVGRAVLAAGLLAALLAVLNTPWSARHPRPSFVAYLLDQDAGRAWRTGRPELRTHWSDAALRMEGGRITSLRHWAWAEPLQAAPARIAPGPPPGLTLEREGDGELRLVVVPTAGTRALTLLLDAAATARLVSVGQAPASLLIAPGRTAQVSWSAPGAQGLALRLRPQAAGHGALEVRYIAELDHWPAGVAPPPTPPTGVMAVGRSGETFVTGTRRLAW